MGGHRGGGHIIGRVLHRGKGINLLPQREDDDAARVLSRGPPHPHAALDNAVNLAVSLSRSPLLVVFLHIAVGGLVRQGADGPRPEGLALAENDLRIVVGPCSGTRRRNSGQYPAPCPPLKPRKVSKGMSKPSFSRGVPQTGQSLVRHIAARHAGEFFTSSESKS